MLAVMIYLPSQRLSVIVNNVSSVSEPATIKVRIADQHISITVVDV